MRRTRLIAVLALCLSLAACAERINPAELKAEGTHPAWLAGNWQGTAYQVSSSKDERQAEVSITFSPDGAWRAITPAGISSGSSWLVRDRLLLDGASPDGAHIRYTLMERSKSSGHELWGMVEASFGSAMLSLSRVRTDTNLRHRTKERRMSTLVVIGYDDQFKADEVRLALLKMQKDYLIDLEDAVVAVKDHKGKVRLHQAVNITAAGAVSGGFWGTLIGLLFLNPLLGMAVGATAGAVSGALTDVGINDKFMKDLAGTMKPGSSTLFVLVRTATPDKVLDEIKGTGGTVLKTSLSHDDEVKLQAALSAAKQ